ncbi:MAG: 23S rRNA (guanosine(2251)-2'-O)-methyltransferase RlmB [Patescibacteria group bacterium]
MKRSETFIYGKHAVKEALEKRPEAFTTLYLSHSFEDAWVRDRARSLGIKILPITGKKLPGGVSNDATHQGVIARVLTATMITPYKDFIAELEPTEATALVVLGEVQDPHNVGAVIRSAAAFGLSAVLIPEHRQAPVTGTVIKVSAGAAFSVPLVSIGNVNTTLKDLKDKGFWVYGLAGEGESSLYEETFSKPTVFVLGNEADGLREKTREACDQLITIPISDRVESLNASVSAGTVFSQWSQQHPGALG